MTAAIAAPAPSRDRRRHPCPVGDGGPLGRMTATDFPMAGFFIAVTAGGALILAALAVARVWVPFDWWRVLESLGALLSLVLMGLFFGPTKILPIATALVILTPPHSAPGRRLPARCEGRGGVRRSRRS